MTKSTRASTRPVSRRKAVVTSVCVDPEQLAEIKARIVDLGRVVSNWSHYFQRLAEIDIQQGTLGPVLTPPAKPVVKS